MSTKLLKADLRSAAWLLLGASLAMVGCFGGPPEPSRYPVSGSVMLDGMPLPEGKINFMTPQTGAIDSLDIKDGKFSGKAQAGDRRVEINAYQVEVVNKDGMQSEAQTDLIPPEYNKESKLTATVTAAGPNTFSFEVKSK
jgi:hypothetical protein